MNFADLLREETKWSETENGEVCKTTTDNPLLDLFATIGALRSRSEDEIVKKFILADNYDSIHALRCVFYARDIRGGLGERNTFRILIHFIGDYHPYTLIKNFKFISEMGRWDDFYFLIGTKVENEMWRFIKAQLDSDTDAYLKGQPISLLAKWLKKADSTSKNTKKLGIYTAKNLGMPVYEYKRLCNKLRKHIDVVEQKMSANEWSEIDYSKVPSKAMMNYRSAFMKHDQDRFDGFINKVKSGEEKINSSTLYPYEIVEKVMKGLGDMIVLEEQWKALPNFVDGEFNVLVMADVSGSMDGRPLYSAIGLALYFAQRNRGKYHNLYMTFSEDPDIVQLQDNVGFVRQLKLINNSNWGFNTNLYRALDYILRIAIENDCPSGDIPKALLVVTDMEIDSAMDDDLFLKDRSTSATKIRKKFEKYGYECPKIVFWNVNSRNDTFLADKDDTNTLLVSGQSPSIFRQIMKCLDKTPEQMMIATLDSDRYNKIR